VQLLIDSIEEHISQRLVAVFGRQPRDLLRKFLGVLKWTDCSVEDAVELVELFDGCKAALIDE